jgi:hypothetical protein
MKAFIREYTKPEGVIVGEGSEGYFFNLQYIHLFLNLGLSNFCLHDFKWIGDSITVHSKVIISGTGMLPTSHIKSL